MAKHKAKITTNKQTHDISQSEPEQLRSPIDGPGIGIGCGMDSPKSLSNGVL